MARSSVEAEFGAITQGVCELLSLPIILNDLKIKWNGHMRLYCDNESPISIAHNTVHHDNKTY